MDFSMCFYCLGDIADLAIPVRNHNPANGDSFNGQSRPKIMGVYMRVHSLLY